MNAKISRIAGAVLCVAAMLLCMITSFALPVRAADCTLTLICKNQDEPVANVKWNVFRVGEKNSKGEYVLTGDFADYPVSLKNITTSSAMQDAAVTLENYAVLDGVAPALSAVTDEEGTAVLGNVDTGLYLVCGEKYFTDTLKVTPSPMLLEFTDDEISQGSIIAYPKFEIETIPAETEAEFGVRKIWDMLGQFDEFRPVDVTVGIYCDTELVETVVLSEDNNWEYFWTGDILHDWRVKEIDIPANFTVIYRNNETLFNVENTYTTTMTGGDESESSSQTDSSSSHTDSSTGGSGSSGSLPQTGSLWWPVPVLAGSGVILIAVGGRMNKKRK